MTMMKSRIAVTTITLGLLAAPMMLAQTTSTPTQTAKPPAAKPPAAAVPPAGAKAFATAQAATEALIQAATTFDEPALIALFGADNKDLVSTGDAVRDKSYAAAFAALAKQGLAVAINSTTPSRATVEVGPDRWPLPVPLVRVAGKWYFDAKAGRDEILFRRIGGNELDAIEICRGYVEAQKEYALDLHD
ncbi:MAG TPA: DUF2950 family protein, partial [Vicinamibacterales bacterium]|nr:DUF2950 family protein [Vicinamibacterales bacterium]